MDHILEGTRRELFDFGEAKCVSQGWTVLQICLSPRMFGPVPVYLKHYLYQAQRACALRALGLLLADGSPTHTDPELQAIVQGLEVSSP